MIKARLWPNRYEWSIAVGSIHHSADVTEVVEVGHSLSPSLTAGMIGPSAEFVADPFIIEHRGRAFLFFEKLERWPPKGVIDVATYDGHEWCHLGTALRDEDHHFSYPHIFRHDGTFWLVPETNDMREIRLYESEEFPLRWNLRRKLRTDRAFVDPTVFRHRGCWWLFTLAEDGLWIYYAESLIRDSWEPHPRAPFRRHFGERLRPGGTVSRFGNDLIRWVQIDEPRYGTGVTAKRIDELSRERFSETPLPHLTFSATGAGWNGSGMHHVSIWRGSERTWIAVDGRAYCTL